MNINNNCPREFDFALIVGGVVELTENIEDALFEAGCDDATIGMQYGRLYMEFSRTAESLETAILSAINDVRKASIGADVLRVDECDLVTQADIARRIDRTRATVSQYINAERGPGNFPPPICHLAEGKPLWAWCDVTSWLAAHNIIRPEEQRNAEVVAAINTWLDAEQQARRHPDLIRKIDQSLRCTPCGGLDGGHRPGRALTMLPKHTDHLKQASQETLYQVRIADGRLTVAGIEVDDVLDHSEQTYEQSAGFNPQSRVRLAFSAGAKAGVLYARSLRRLPVLGWID